MSLLDSDDFPLLCMLFTLLLCISRYGEEVHQTLANQEASDAHR
jgi:hypothetical protein